jgi:hypothetical protein
VINALKYLNINLTFFITKIQNITTENKKQKQIVFLVINALKLLNIKIVSMFTKKKNITVKIKDICNIQNCEW